MAASGSDDDQTQSFTALAAGTKVSHYKIISKIGAGGMGEVYLAQDTELDRTVALKFLPAHLCQDAEARARFTREAKAAARLDHANIVAVYEVGEFQGRPFFSMAHIEGKSLKEVIAEGKLTVHDTIQLTKHICEGLNEAHAAGVIHRDIKPGNIIIDSKGNPRILDFGLATVAGEEKLTKTGSTLGTAGYMSPEQIQGKQVDHRSDLFSVGVILYEMLTGRRPFQGDNDAAVARSITDHTPEPIARYKSGTTGELQQIVNKALSKNPSVRYQHADGILADLERLTSEIPPASRRKRVYWIPAVAVALLVGYFGITSFLTKPPEPDMPKRLVVLPFENIGASDQDYFASGITEEITSRLSNISGLAVVSNATANQYRHSNKPTRQIGEELSADFIVNGSIQWQESPDGGKRLRLTAHLINADEDVAVWSKTYDTVMTEVFSVQSDIAENVSEQMGIKLNVIDKRQIWERYTNSQEAYDFYLRGHRYISELGGFGPIRDFRLAADMYEKAVALDSTFAEAYSRLAYTYCRIWGRGDHSDSIKAGALKAAQRAFELGGDTVSYEGAMANYYYFVLEDYKKALDALDKAFEDDPDNPTYLKDSHNCLRRMGDWDEAYRRKKILVERFPEDIMKVYDLGQDCLYMRRYKEAETLFNEVIRKRPDFFGVYYLKVVLYLNWMGDISKARQVIEQSRGKIDSVRWQRAEQRLDVKEGKFDLALSRITIPPLDSSSYYFDRARIYGSSRQTTLMRAYFDSAFSYVERFLADNPDSAIAHSRMGIVYAGLGRRDEAIREGKRAVELAPIEQDAFGNNFDYLDNLLLIYIMLDEKEKALDMLDHMLSVDHYIGLSHVLIDPDYSPMLDYPNFDRIVQRHGNEYARALWEKHRANSI